MKTQHGNCYTRVEAVMPSSSLVRTIAYRAEAPRYAHKQEPAKRTYKHSDETVLTIIRRHRDGDSYLRLASEFDISEGSIKQWCSGLNRSHLLARVEREEREVA